MISISAAVRKEAGLKGGDPIRVTLTVAGTPREVILPADLSPSVTPRLDRYAPVKVRPATLSVQFIKDLLEVTGNCKAHSFADVAVRDHALIRMLCEGVRRTEVVQMQLSGINLVRMPNALIG